MTHQGADRKPAPACPPPGDEKEADIGAPENYCPHVNDETL